MEEEKKAKYDYQSNPASQTLALMTIKTRSHTTYSGCVRERRKKKEKKIDNDDKMTVTLDKGAVDVKQINTKKKSFSRPLSHEKAYLSTS